MTFLTSRTFAYLFFFRRTAQIFYSTRIETRLEAFKYSYILQIYSPVFPCKWSQLSTQDLRLSLQAFSPANKARLSDLSASRCGPGILPYHPLASNGVFHSGIRVAPLVILVEPGAHHYERATPIQAYVRPFFKDRSITWARIDKEKKWRPQVVFFRSSGEMMEWWNSL